MPILRLRHTVDAATNTINDINDRAGPILGNVNTTIENVNTDGWSRKIAAVPLP